MGKSIKIAILFLLIGGSILGLSAGYEYVKTGTFGNMFHTQDITSTQKNSLEVDQFHEIDINTISADIIIQEGSDWNVSYVLPEEEKILVAEVFQGVLRIKTELDTKWWKFMRITRTPRKMIQVTVPRGTELTDVSIHTTSGDIFLPTSKIDNLEIKTISGDIDGVDVTAGRSRIQTTSGDIEIKRFTTSESVIETISGDVEMEGALSDFVQVTTTSGDVELQGNIETVVTSSISGDFELRGTFSKITGKTTSGEYSVEGAILTSSSITTTSGDVDISLVELPSIEVQTRGSSRIKGKKSTAYFSDSPEKLTIKTTSGDVDISTK